MDKIKIATEKFECYAEHCGNTIKVGDEYVTLFAYDWLDEPGDDYCLECYNDYLNSFW